MRSNAPPRFGCALIATGMMLGTTGLADAQDRLPLVPQPAAMTRGTGAVTIAAGSTVSADPGDAGTTAAARLLLAHVKTERGLTLATGARGTDHHPSCHPCSAAVCIARALSRQHNRAVLSVNSTRRPRPNGVGALRSTRCASDAAPQPTSAR